MRFRYGRRRPRLKERPKLPPGLWLPRRGSRRRVDHLVYSVPPFFAPRGGGRICGLGKPCRAVEGAESGGKYAPRLQRPHNVRTTFALGRRNFLGARFCPPPPAVWRCAFSPIYFARFLPFPLCIAHSRTAFLRLLRCGFLKVCGDFFGRIACGVFRFVKVFWG